MTMTPAERHELLVNFAVDDYREKYIRMFSYMAQGGRIPGMPKMSDDEIRAFFHSLHPEAFTQLALQSPELAMKALQDFERVEAR